MLQMRHALIFSFVILLSCRPMPDEPVVYYHPPDESVETAVIHGMESRGKLLGKGHEKIYICGVDGEKVLDSDLGEPIRITSGEHLISVCYREGGNKAFADLDVSLEPSTEYQILLGEHSWTVVNFWIEYKATNKLFIALTTVPKIAGIFFMY